MADKHFDWVGDWLLGGLGRRVAAVGPICHRPMTTIFALVAFTSWFALGMGSDAARAQVNPPPRVLLLYPYSNLFPMSVMTGEAARKQMIERSSGPLEFYSDFLDLGRFWGDAHEGRTAQYLVEKYRERKPDLVIALGPRSLQFTLRHRADLGFDGPIVFCCTSRDRLAALNLHNNVTGIISEFDFTRTLALAQRLQPDAGKIVVVAGASEFDQQSAQIARRQLAPYEQKSDIKYLVGLPYDELMQNLKGLPRNSIVLLLSMFADRTGRLFISTDIVEDVANTSTAPVYSPYEPYLGRGVVGGHMDSLERVGAEVADLALKVLAGANPDTLLPRATSGNVDRVDWRQLQRFAIDESRLPTGSEIRFRPPTAWEQYRSQILLIGLALVVQSSLIVGLIIEHRRRHRAEVEARRRMGELAHMNRSAAIGEMSASIAHEINQPLTGIVMNAGSALRFLGSAPPQLEDARTVLNMILRDGDRASNVIGTIRSMFKKDVQDRVPISINEPIRETLALLRSELDERDISLNMELTDGLPQVLGNRVQLQQVILNLIRNAAEAMGSVNGRARVVRVRSEAEESGDVIVTIGDSGPGIDVEHLKRIFEPFFTTKPDGMGMGLSICRSVVEAHAGRLTAAPAEPTGMNFQIVLPRRGTVT